ncbi:carboxylating nicotinate-nucleotide diphosphorylase [Fredinandcohnia salidurans]|uniref:nicotinate-nucleotide diphosphorylase (carboxylating) n=1 Tax=Fredinandcohnia salidurans TaxID=2595041 RepID=A0ABW4MMY2_9BACI
MNLLKLRKMLQEFLLEDIGELDVTSQTIFPIEQTSQGVFIAKEDGIISGLAIIKEAYHLLDSTIEIELRFSDGDRVSAGDTIATVSGPTSNLLTGERVILNLIQRMSGIATVTNRCVEALNDASIRICDTRKTIPGLRMLDKYAVVTGGGKNHRFGLYDGVMIKDNHIAYCGSITKAVKAVREKIGHMVKIEVETESKEEVLEAVEAGADVIMFDNRSPEEVKEFTKLVPKGIITEASGGITLDNLATYSGTGVQYISLGFLTHSVKALDISLQVKEGNKKSSFNE